MTDNINGIPIRWNAEADRELLGGLLEEGSAAEMKSGNAAQKMMPVFSGNPFKQQSPFDNPCDGTCEHDDNFFWEGIDFDKLAGDLGSSMYGTGLMSTKFDYNLYQSNLTYSVTTEYGSDDGYMHKGITKANEKGQSVEVGFSGKLNKVSCCINDIPALRIRVSPSNISYGLSYHYSDVDAFETNRNFTGFSTEYEIEDKYVAIFIDAYSFDDLLFFLTKSKKEYLHKAVENIVFSKFQAAFLKAANSGSDLETLYRRAPDFVIKRRAESAGGNELLWNDLIKLLDYDDTGFWSFVKDSSNAVIKLLRGYSDTVFLFDQFYANPKLIKRLYSDMDSSSEIDGKRIANRTIFVSLLSAICNANLSKTIIIKQNFYVGKNYKPDSNLMQKNDKYEDQIFLAQLTAKQYEVTKSIGGGIPGASHYEYYKSHETVFEPVDEGAYYHPMDMVTLIDEKTGRPQQVAAMFVKDIADQIEWAAVMEIIRLGFNILVIILSLVTLATGPGPLMLLISSVDLALATADTFILSIQDELKKTEGGREFLEIWNTLYTIGGFATGAPLLIRSLFTAGVKLFNKLTVSNARNFIMSVLTKIVLEINIANFAKNTLRVMETAEVVQLGGFLARLQEAGVLFMRGTIILGNKVQEGFAVIYKGRVIASGTEKEVKAVLRSFRKAQGPKLLKLLDEMFRASFKLSEEAKRVLQSMADKAKSLVKEKRPTACGVLEDGANRVFNYSFKQKLAPGQFPKGLHPLVQEWLDLLWRQHAEGKIKLPLWHGKCAEVLNISEWLKAIDPELKFTITQARDSFEGVISHARQIGSDKYLSHFSYKRACGSCNELLKHFNINEVK